ncbi:hypothetical protein [Bradyrhizobium sp. AUGA SZCCT0182]|uniref:hypothetical protein n=1 Tax=Bradyrhizobium sp. AUGA SZCCT0182 TaxID=2807667 RepID=UPI001BA44299|nr:hypothetical protein [Bradyrhizobium sp. AUGA SZCCT0182]MBR1234276.1 hypothetical protein [Bradyrhizobium sp. AUGA SZCCT0182]
MSSTPSRAAYSAGIQVKGPASCRRILRTICNWDFGHRPHGIGIQNFVLLQSSIAATAGNQLAGVSIHPMISPT